MEYRQLGRSGLKVSVLSLGAGTFGGTTEFSRRWGATDAAEAARLLDICLDAGLNFFDSANTYDNGTSEQVMGQAIKNRRNDVLISIKATFPTGPGPNENGSSRHHLIRACKASLKRLGAAEVADDYLYSRKTRRCRLHTHPEAIALLDDASFESPIYPYWRQRNFDERTPSLRLGASARADRPFPPLQEKNHAFLGQDRPRHWRQ